jgi:hypothetical protein
MPEQSNAAKVTQLAHTVLDAPSFQPIVGRAARAAEVPAGARSAALAAHMALAYAEGYVRGWNTARQERSDFIPDLHGGDA